MTPRPKPMEWLRRWRNQDITKVLTGVQRCGKSTALSFGSCHSSSTGCLKSRGLPGIFVIGRSRCAPPAATHGRCRSPKPINLPAKIRSRCIKTSVYTDSLKRMYHQLKQPPQCLPRADRCGKNFTNSVTAEGPPSPAAPQKGWVGLKKADTQGISDQGITLFVDFLPRPRPCLGDLA